MFRISGVVTSHTPINIADPAPARVDMSGRFVSRDDGGFPCIRTRHAMLPAGHALAATMGPDLDEDAENLGEAGGKEEADAPAGRRRDAVWVPILPANGLRGRLRRLAAREVYQALMERQEHLSLDAYNVMECGAATGAPDSATPSLDEVLAAAAHPYFGLFGGGPRLFGSNLRVDEGLAICQASAPFLPESMMDFMSVGRLTQVAFKRRNDDVAQFVDLDTQQRIVPDHAAAVADYQDHAARQRGKGKDEGGERGVRSFHAVEAVRRGVSFALRFDIGGQDGCGAANDAHLGLFLLALRGLMASQRLGGMGQIGFGRFGAPRMILTDTTSKISGEIFQVVSDPNETVEYVFNEDHPIVARALDAWAAARDTLDASQTEAFCASNDKPKEAKRQDDPGADQGVDGAAKKRQRK